MPHKSSDPDSITAESVIDKAGTIAADTLQWVEESTRNEPLKAIGVALAAGYVVPKLPIFSVFGALVRLALVLARPFALILGIVKVSEFLLGSMEHGE